MIKKAITFFLAILSSCTFSQNITLAELVELHDSRLDQIEEKLTIKGWTFFVAEAPTEVYDMSSVAFSYSSADKSQFGFFTYMTGDIKRSVSVLTDSQNKYFEYLNDVKNLNAELLETFTSASGKIIKV